MVFVIWLSHISSFFLFIDIFQYLTQYSTSTRQNALYVTISRTFSNVEEEHVCIKVTSEGEFSSIPASLVSKASDYESQGYEFESNRGY